MVSTLLVRDPVTTEELGILLSEFPQIDVVRLPPRETIRQLDQERVQAVDILYGSSLTEEELSLLPNLRWIHSPTPYLDKLKLPEEVLGKRVLVTSTKEENIHMVGEFAIAATLAFSKNLFNWVKATEDFKALRNKIWEITGRTFLQVHLGKVGSEIARRAKLEGFQVIGVQKNPSFHPHCKKTYPFQSMKELLPEADVVSLALSRDHIHEPWFSRNELSLMKEDSILLIFGAGSVLDVDALLSVAKEKNFRGILIDAHFSDETLLNPLKDIKNVLLTRESSFLPKSEEHLGFHVFLYNLRQYLFENFTEMKNLYQY